MLRRLSGIAFLTVIFWQLLAFAEPEANVGEEPVCERVSTDTLRVWGATDEAMLACFQTAFDPQVTQLLISSHGGDVSIAMDIAELIAPVGLHMTIERECNSSCANYLIPVARRLTMAPRGLILIHGSVDDAFIKRLEAGGMEARRLDIFKSLHARQADFMTTYDVPPAWLLFRRLPVGNEEAVQGLAGRFEHFGPPRPGRSFIMVEFEFIRSCFPDLQFDPWIDTAPQLARSDETARQYWADMNYYRTASARCITGNFSEGP